MKVRLNKQVMAQLAEVSPIVRQIVGEWQQQYRKAHIDCSHRAKFYTGEDCRYTAVNITNGKSHTEQAAGEFSLGAATMRPGAECVIPEGVVVIERGFFMGVPFLNIYQGTAKNYEENKLGHVMALV